MVAIFVFSWDKLPFPIAVGRWPIG